jgi:hypothetical protein
MALESGQVSLTVLDEELIVKIIPTEATGSLWVPMHTKHKCPGSEVGLAELVGFSPNKPCS